MPSPLPWLGPAVPEVKMSYPLTDPSQGYAIDNLEVCTLLDSMGPYLGCLRHVFTGGIPGSQDTSSVKEERVLLGLCFI